MTQLEMVLAVAFGVQFLSTVSLAIQIQKHDRRIRLLKDIINEIGMYLATHHAHQHQEEENNEKSKSKTR
jgi:hypothetical protein